MVTSLIRIRADRAVSALILNDMAGNGGDNGEYMINQSDGLFPSREFSYQGDAAYSYQVSHSH